MLNKLITSSADPRKIATTVKGLLTLLVPVIIILTDLDEADLGPIIDAIEILVLAGCTFVGAFLTFVGLIRKVRLGRWVHPDVY